jgi:putative glycosyltransferase (TIGR04372 family)
MIDLEKAIRLAERSQLKFVIPPAFPWAPGHYVHDVHRFFLELECCNIDPDAIYIYPFHEAEIPNVILSIIKPYASKHKNVTFYSSNKLVREISQIALIYPEYTVCTNSPIVRLKLPIGIQKADCRLGPSILGQRYYTVPTSCEFAWTVEYLQACNENPECNPFINAVNQLEGYLPEYCRESSYAVIQAKKEHANTGLPVNSVDYREIIEYLKDTGHNIVVAGREDHSNDPIFKHTYHYSQSQSACFLVDLALFAHSRVSIIGGSGIGIIPAVFKKPFVFNNSAMYTFPQAIYGCVNLPSIVYSNSKKRYLTVMETDSLWPSLPNSWDTPPDKYTGSARHGNPLSMLFKSNELVPITSLSNQFLVQSVATAMKMLEVPPTFTVNQYSRYPNSQIRYAQEFTTMLRSEGILM